MEPVFLDRIEALTGKDGKIEPSEDVNYPTAWLLCPLLTSWLQSSPFLDFLINGLLSRAKGTLESSLVARMMLIINTSALHTTTIVLTTALYELAQRPEVCEVLREEFLRNVGSSDGYDNAAAITTNLPMLDSFLKEVMRTSPPGYCKLSSRYFDFLVVCSRLYPYSDFFPRGAQGLYVFQRPARTRRSDGRGPYVRHIPRCTAVSRPRHVQSATILPEARGSPQRAGLHGYLCFGLCLFARSPHLVRFPHCSFHLRNGKLTARSPGRWFAGAGMKVVLIKLLERYEIRLEGGGSKPRPISFQASFTPNMTAKIQLRRRK